MRVSQSEAERLRFWAGRKAAFPAAGRISPDYYCMDGTIPRKRWRDADGASRRWKRNTACAASTSSMPATATCIR
jgi:FAD/FMN-containing dehydrogenase